MYFTVDKSDMTNYNTLMDHIEQHGFDISGNDYDEEHLLIVEKTYFFIRPEKNKLIIDFSLTSNLTTDPPV